MKRTAKINIKVFEALNRAQKQIGVQESRWLLQHITHKNMAQLIVSANNELTDGEQYNLENALIQRQQKIPLAYILQNTYFADNEFYVNSDVLVPREDSQTLVNTVIEWAQLIKPNSPINILELGVGSGALMCVVAKRLFAKNINAEFYATDISEKALIVAQKNFQVYKVSPQIYCGNWFNALLQNHCKIKFNIIYSNPPYIAKDDTHLLTDGLMAEPQIALTDGGDGLAAIKQIINNAGNFLSPQGKIAIEHGANQSNEVGAIFSHNGYDNIRTIKDDYNLPRVTTAELIKSTKK